MEVSWIGRIRKTMIVGICVYLVHVSGISARFIKSQVRGKLTPEPSLIVKFNKTLLKAFFYQAFSAVFF